MTNCAFAGELIPGPERWDGKRPTSPLQQGELHMITISGTGEFGVRGHVYAATGPQGVRLSYPIEIATLRYPNPWTTQLVVDEPAAAWAACQGWGDGVQAALDRWVEMHNSGEHERRAEIVERALEEADDADEKAEAENLSAAWDEAIKEIKDAAADTAETIKSAVVKAVAGYVVLELVKAVLRR